jgi:hypothetical protein
MKAYTKRESRDGTTKDLRRTSFNKEIRSSSIIKDLKLSERGNCKASGMHLMLFIRYSPPE